MCFPLTSITRSYSFVVLHVVVGECYEGLLQEGIARDELAQNPARIAACALATS